MIQEIYAQEEESPPSPGGGPPGQGQGQGKNPKISFPEDSTPIQRAIEDKVKGMGRCKITDDPPCEKTVNPPGLNMLLLSSEDIMDE